MFTNSKSVASYAIGLTHYHKVHDTVYMGVERLLRTLVVKYVEGNRRVQVKMDADTAQCLYEFLDEMKWGYLHPRSTSARMLLKRSQSLC